MTRIVKKGDVTFLIASVEANQQCDSCGKVDELRPYGPGGSMICYDCGQKDPEGTKQRFLNLLNGEDATNG